MDSDALAFEVRLAYDAVAVEYASRFAGTEPEQAVDLAMIDHFISLLVPDGPEVLDAGVTSRHVV